MAVGDVLAKGDGEGLVMFEDSDAVKTEIRNMGQDVAEMKKDISRILDVIHGAARDPGLKGDVAHLIETELNRRRIRWFWYAAGAALIVQSLWTVINAVVKLLH